jgi:hypothetical protein
MRKRRSLSSKGEDTMAQFIKTAEGAAAKFPFELKDAFRDAFPSAKWNSVAKQWEVGGKSVARLQQWLAKVDASGVEAELAARDEADMSEKDLAALASSVEAVRSEIAAARAGKTVADEARARADALRNQLAAARAELEAAKAEKAAAEAASEAAVADVEARVAHIATRDVIEKLRGEMRRNWIPKSFAKPLFEESQSKLRGIFRALREAGVECEAARLAANANFNRKDRDLADLSVRIEFVAA